MKGNHSRPKSFSESPIWKETAVFCKKMTELTEQFKKELREKGRIVSIKYATKYDGRSVPVMEGNSKTGALRSLSMRPILDCGNCSKCIGQCYDLRHDVTNGACLEYRCATAAIYEVDNDRFWKEVEAQATVSCLWRWHIGGDIMSYYYLCKMVKIARECPHCKFLAFTKMFDIVNKYVYDNGELPENLHIIFSAWPGLQMDNPYNLPVAFPIFADKDIEENEEIARFSDSCPKFYWKCNDNCTDCALRDQGCFRLGKGESVGFNYH